MYVVQVVQSATVRLHGTPSRSISNDTVAPTPPGSTVIHLPPTSVESSTGSSSSSSSSTVIPLGTGDHPKAVRPSLLVMRSVQSSLAAVRQAPSAVQPRLVQPACAIQPKTAADPPAPRSPAGPLGRLRWPSSSSTLQQQQWWAGGPIGGTLSHLNPPLPDHEAHTSHGSSSTAVKATPVSALLPRRQARAPVAVAAGRAPSSHPLVAVVKHPGSSGGSSSKLLWGSLIGGALHISPEAPSGFGHERPSWGGSGASSSGASSGGGAGQGGALGGGSRSAGGRQAGASAAARLAVSSGVPPGLGVARAGVALMAAMAAGAVAIYSCSDSKKQEPTTTTTPATLSAAARSSAGVGVSSAAAALPHPPGLVGGAVGAAAAAGGMPTAEAGSGYHEWMVARLSAALDSFDGEQAMLRAELALLTNIQPAARTRSGSGTSATSLSSLWHGVRRLLALSGGGAADGAAAVPAATAAAAGAALNQDSIAPLSAADVAARLAEIREQVESIDTLKSALGAELADHQQLLASALEVERRAAQQHRSVLVSR